MRGWIFENNIGTRVDWQEQKAAKHFFGASQNTQIPSIQNKTQKGEENPFDKPSHTVVRVRCLNIKTYSSYLHSSHIKLQQQQQATVAQRKKEI